MLITTHQTTTLLPHNYHPPPSLPSPHLNTSTAPNTPHLTLIPAPSPLPTRSKACIARCGYRFDEGFGWEGSN